MNERRATALILSLLCMLASAACGKSSSEDDSMVKQVNEYLPALKAKLASGLDPSGTAMADWQATCDTLEKWVRPVKGKEALVNDVEKTCGLDLPLAQLTKEIQIVEASPKEVHGPITITAACFEAQVRVNIDDAMKALAEHHHDGEEPVKALAARLAALCPEVK
jgi:hypothetical protein